MGILWCGACYYTDLQEDAILKLDNSAQIFNTLSNIPGDVTDAAQLLEVFTRILV